MRKIILLVISLLFTGCGDRLISKSQAYLDFTQKYGSHSRFFVMRMSF